MGVEIVSYSNTHRSVYLNLRPGLILFISFLILTSFTIVFSAGSYYGISRYSNIFINKHLTSLEKQQKEIRQAKEQSKTVLKFMASRLGKLQNQLTRINALGLHMVSLAKIEDLDLSIDDSSTEFNLRLSDHSTGNIPDFLSVFEQLSYQVQEQSEKMIALETILSNRSISENIFPSIMPVKAYVSSWFGPRNDPLNENGKTIFHEGIDFSADKGSNIVSTAAGIVTWSGPLDNYGNVIEINHGNGYVTRYAHNYEHFVNVGETVNKGQLIGAVGNSGRSTGPHLHYEIIKNGIYMDPKKFMKLN